MKATKIDESATERAAHCPQGFSVVEFLIVIVIIGVVSSVALVGITRSRQSLRLQNSARIFSSYVEKARMDAIRRRSTTNIDVAGPNTFLVTIDWDGTGTATPRTFTLENGVQFTDSTNTPYTVDGSGTVSASNGEVVSASEFNWRGRTALCSVLFRMQNSNNERSMVQVAGSGDVTIDSVIATPASITVTNVNKTADVSGNAVINGSFPHPELNPCSVSGGSGFSNPPPTATCVGGNISGSVGSISVRKNGLTSIPVNIIVTGPGTISTTADANLRVTPTSQSVTSSTGGTVTFTVSSQTRVKASNPPFTVVFTNPCNSVTLYVTVTN
jgi:prepilin-type N-terminal cleavage/methylation domain-containing protein